jgi:hypothetical protein
MSERITPIPPRQLQLSSERQPVRVATARRLVRQATEVCFAVKLNDRSESLCTVSRKAALAALNFRKAVAYVYVSTLWGALVIG